jgi:nucleotide-binding universal stress UspA family protein
MASDDPRPAVLAYDGSESADAALRAGVALIGSRPLLVATVWESAGMAYALGPMDTTMPGVGDMPMDPATIAELEHAGSERAARVADAGVRLAIELGAAAEPVVLDSPADAASVIADFAEAREAAVVIVGARGHGRLRERVLGSTSHKLLHHCTRPVLVVHKQD